MISLSRSGRSTFAVAAILLSVGLRTANGDSRWHWQNPLPHGNTIWAAWSNGADDVWLVGKLGTISHYSGATWTNMLSGTTATLSAVWGSGPSDVYAAGQAASCFTSTARAGRPCPAARPTP